MAQLSYDIVPCRGGWAIELTPAPGEAFPTQQAAFDAAAAMTHKLQFVGYSVRVNPGRDERQSAA